MTSFVSCSDKSSAEFEVSLEGQLVKTDVNKGKWPITTGVFILGN